MKKVAVSNAIVLGWWISMDFLTEQEMADLQRACDYGPSGVLYVVVNRIYIRAMLAEIRDRRAEKAVSVLQPMPPV